MKKNRLCCKDDSLSLNVKKQLISYLKQANFIITNESPDIIIAIGGDNKKFINIKYIETKSCSSKLKILKFNNFSY